MRDSQVVASIVAGDPEGLAAAYDRYADPLYKYCRSMLSDQADAADAVQDTFIIAASRLARLRDPDRLRAWLYAVARNECLRIRRAAKGTSALGEALGDADAAERAGLCALLTDAAQGLGPGERELLELRLRQGLGSAEVALVLGVSPRHAHSLLSRARDQLTACLGVLLTGSAGSGDCGGLGSLLDGWDGRLTVPLRKRVHRHIEQCETCSSRRAFELRPAMLFDLSPGAAMAAAATESLRLAAGAPAGLREHTLALAAGQGPAAAAHRAAAISRADAFTGHGFPRAARDGAATAGARFWQRGGAGGVSGVLRAQRGPAAAAAVVLAVIVPVAAFALAGNTGQRTPTADVQRRPLPSAPVTAVDSLQPGPAALASVPATPTLAAPSLIPTPAPATPSQSPTPQPGSLTQVPAGGTQARPASLPVTPGGQGTTIYLSASGSGSNWAVTWSVTVANDPGHVISVSPASSGTLTPASPNAKVTITASQSVQCGRGHQPACPAITISPDGAVYTVLTGRG